MELMGLVARFTDLAFVAADATVLTIIIENVKNLEVLRLRKNGASPEVGPARNENGRVL